jgi:hypothetical protein
MANGLVIKSVANRGDQVTAAVSVSGTPSGTPRFLINRTPDYNGAIPAVSSGSGPYLLTVPYPSLWYVWIVDDNGPCAEPEAGLIGTDAGENVPELGAALRDILWNNKKGIEAALKQWDVSWTLKQAVYGYGGDVTDWPAVLVMQPKFTSEYIAAPYVRQYSFTCAILCVILHESEQSQLPAAGAFGNIVERILSQPAYDQIVLGNDQVIDFGYIRQGGVTEEPVGDSGKFLAVASLQWGGIGDRVDSGTLRPHVT